MWFKDFVQNWRTGIRIILAVGVLGGLGIISGMLGALLVFGVVVALPAELILQVRIGEHYYVLIAIVGAGLWGVAMVGRFKAYIVGAINEK